MRTEITTIDHWIMYPQKNISLQNDILGEKKTEYTNTTTTKSITWKFESEFSDTAIKWYRVPPLHITTIGKHNATKCNLVCWVGLQLAQRQLLPVSQSRPVLWQANLHGGEEGMRLASWHHDMKVSVKCRQSGHCNYWISLIWKVCGNLFSQNDVASCDSGRL